MVQIMSCIPFCEVQLAVYKIQKIAFDYLDAPICRICSADTPMAYSPVLVDEFLPNKMNVIQKVKEVMYL